MTKLIKLGHKELYAIVDDEDYDILMNNRWCANGKKDKDGVYHWYAERGVSRKALCKGKKHLTIWMHRQIMEAPDEDEVDHINGNGLDNRRENLRVCTHKQNHLGKHTGWGKSKFKGVMWDKKTEKWVAYIHLDLGSFDTEEEAAGAYNKAAALNYGEYASMNICSIDKPGNVV